MGKKNEGMSGVELNKHLSGSLRGEEPQATTAEAAPSPPWTSSSCTRQCTACCRFTIWLKTLRHMGKDIEGMSWEGCVEVE